MLQITIPADEDEMWDEEREEFIPATNSKEQVLRLEHSLVSLSKWESKWQKPFISSEKTDAEMLDYIKCMTITPNVPPDVYDRLTEKNVKEITDYINAPMTATTFSEQRGKGRGGRGEVVTSELIYYWMIKHNIPFECEKWHIKRLLTLIRICEIKSEAPKKRSQREIMSRNAALNAARKKRLNTKG